jgi:hypothetical protein
MQLKQLEYTHLATPAFPLLFMTYISYPLVALLILGTTACQRTDATPADQGIMGEWHWVSTVGGLTGKQTYTPASTGSNETWVFKADSTYQRDITRQGGTLVKEQGTFSLGSVKSIHTGQATRALILRGQQAQTFLLEEVSTRLALSDNYYDGFGHTYER